ncbi:MAG: hypothetical protein HYX94_11300 [Chloroflexi bacterium]|nr:hypothetical protein [Chloroflexota bacterium]
MRKRAISTGVKRRWLRLLSIVSITAVLAPPAPAILPVKTDARGLAQTQEGLRVVESDTRHVVLELDVPGYTTDEQSMGETVYAAIVAPGLSPGGLAGQPQLPVRGAMVGIPPEARASLRVLADDWRRDSIVHPPLPVPTATAQADPAQILLPQPDLAYAPDPSIYGGNRLYPGEVARITEIGNWRGQRYARVEFSPLQYDPAARQLVFHRRLRVEILFSYPFLPAENGAFTPDSLAGPFLQNALVNHDTAKSWRTDNRPASPPGPAYPSVLSEALPWYKVAVDGDGIYQVDCSRLASVGADLASLDPRTLKLFKGGVELAVDVAGQDDGRCDEGDYVEFFGQMAQTMYTDTNVYWLTFGGAAGRRMDRRDGSSGGAVASAFTDTVHLEEDRLYRPYAPRAEHADHWFWRFLPYGGSASADFAFNLDDPVAGAFPATVQANLVGYGGDHRTLVSVNDNPVDDASWNGSGERRTMVSFSGSYLSAGQNQIRVSELGPSGSLVFVDSFDVTYVRSFRAVTDTLRFRQPAGSWQYDIPGFSQSTLEAFDITNPANVARVVSTTVSSPCPCALGFASALTTTAEYLAIAAGQRRAPVSIARDSPSDLRSTANGADYIAIAYGAFITNVAPLASFRASQGMRVKVVDVQDVYDEFSDGLMDAQAIRDFLAYAYANWQRPAPYFVLLVGDGTFDLKNRMGVGEPTFIPPYLRMVDPWLGETASDSRLVAFEDGAGNALPQMAIGRLPAGSAADVEAMVGKILAYEQNPPGGDWRTTIGFIADRAYDAAGISDSAGNFWSLSDGVVSDPRYVTTTLTSARTYYNSCDANVYPQCALPYPTLPSAAAIRQGIVDAINGGRLIVNFIGHSSIAFWGKDQIFRIDPELNSLANGRKTPVMLDMTCYDGFFHYPGNPSLGEVNVRLAGRGAVASWSATGLGVATGHDYLDRGFFAAVVQQSVRQIGTATMLGKANLWTNGGGGNRDLIDTFVLLGDPATRLALPASATAASRTYLPIIVR